MNRQRRNASPDFSHNQSADGDSRHKRARGRGSAVLTSLGLRVVAQGES